MAWVILMPKTKTIPDVQAAAARPAMPAALELLHPITWFPPMWAFGCGIISEPGGPIRRLGAS